MKRVLSLFGALSAGPQSRADLARTLGLSQLAFSRLFTTAKKIRKSRRFRRWPVDPLLFRIDESGECHSLGDVTAIEGRGFIWSPLSGKPGIFPGVPFFLSDARAQRYLGKGCALRHADLGFPARISKWSGDQILAGLALRGDHLPGNLLIGKESIARLRHAAHVLRSTRK